MSERKRILIVDDEPQILEVLEAYLQREGFETISRASASGAASALAEARPDMMILDITLPDGSGLDVLREHGAELGIPTILLTARTDEVDRIVGLELGADDYITKPFSPREVVARVRAVFRRVQNGEHKARSGAIRLRGLELNPATREVHVAGKPADLTRTEFDILRVLIESPEQVFTRAQLLDAIDDNGAIYERTLDRHINNLRKKIEPDAAQPTYVVTVYGVGYKLKR